MKPKIGILRFPGSNCDRDIIEVLSSIFQISCATIDYRARDLGSVSGVVVPGGFSYGDYLRAGALAAHAPIMADLVRKAQKGLAILGICNGFQILTEARLLPGTLLKNSKQQFVCKSVCLKVESGSSSYHKDLGGKFFKMPIAHGEGNYYIDDVGFKHLQDEGQILFTYSGPDGEVSENFNPNGSRANIAGIINKAGTVIGLMPHPERASFGELGTGQGGIALLESFLAKTAL